MSSFRNHRCHGHYLALTDDVDGLLREILGREGGVCGGKGGSQHLCASNFYSNGILGSTVPLATGIALAQREKRQGGVSTVFIGDGTLGQGVVYESLNYASLWKLPLLVVLEHNGYAQSTPSTAPDRGRRRGARRRASASRRRGSHRPTCARSALRRRSPSGTFARRARRSSSCIDTYRFSPHSKGDDFREPEEIAERRLRDPLSVLGADLDETAASRRAVEERLARAVDEALAAPPAGSTG